MMMSKNLLTLAVMVLLLSCNKEEAEVATVNYYLTSTQSEKFDFILFQFDHTQAILDNEKVEKDLSLPPQQIALDLSNPSEIYLGTASFSPEEIDGYKFRISDVKVVKDNDTIELTQPFQYGDYNGGTHNVSKGSISNINFILDVDASIILGVAGGQNWINPQIAIE